MKILFSGRFDPPHPGHIAQIMRLEEKGRVVVVILDYPERDYPIAYVIEIFKEILKKHNVEIKANNDHFGEITREQLDKFDCDLYAAGNLKVLKHIENIGFPVIYCERAYQYSSRNIKRVLD